MPSSGAGAGLVAGHHQTCKSDGYYGTMDSQDGLKTIALPLFLNIIFYFQMDWFGKCHALVSELFSLKISLDLNIPDIVKHRIHV